jgi:hypothetical protein
MPRLLPATLARLPRPITRLALSRTMSTSTESQKPEILSTTELGSADAKWLSLNKLAWRDQDGKEVRPALLLLLITRLQELTRPSVLLARLGVCLPQDSVERRRRRRRHPHAHPCRGPADADRHH